MPKILGVVLILYISPSLIRIFVQDIRLDLLTAVIRDSSCFMSFIIFYSISRRYEALRLSFKMGFYFCIFFIIAQTVPIISSLLQTWNPRGLTGFYGLQVGSIFVFSYSFGTFILLMIAVESKIRPQSLILLALTQSKSVYLTSFFLMLVYNSFRNNIFLLSALCIVLLLSIDVIRPFVPYLFFLVDTWSTGTIDPSTSYRLIQFSVAFESIQANPFFGNPSSNINIENQFFYWLSEYGLIGTLMRSVSIILLITAVSDRRQRFIVLLILSIVSLSYPVLEAPKISLFVWGLLGSLIALSKKELANVR